MEVGTIETTMMMSVKADGKPAAYIKGLIKIYPEREYAEAFIRGQLHMKTLEDFRRMEATGDGRNDDQEGLLARHDPSKIIIQFGDITFDSSEIVAPVEIHRNAHVFCMFALHNREFPAISRDNLSAFKQTQLIPDECLKLGGHAVFIPRVATFQKRLQAAMSRVGSGALGLVDYVDHPLYVATKNPGFHKPTRFAYQREYRALLHLADRHEGPYNLEVGDLSDICHLNSPTEYNRLIKFRLPDGSEA